MYPEYIYSRKDLDEIADKALSEYYSPTGRAVKNPPFTLKDDWNPTKIIDLDFSEIELRILAYMEGNHEEKNQD